MAPAHPHQDFDAPTGGKAKFSGTFTLGGRLWKIRHRDDIPFEIVKRLMGQEQVDENASQEEQAAQAREVVMQTGPFFEATIIPDEVDDFMEMLDSPKSPLTIGNLRPIMEHVSTVAFSEDEARPTKSSRPSRSGRLQTGRTSEDGSSSPATTQRASAG